MKEATLIIRTLFSTAAFVAVMTMSTPAAALSGDTRLACEALLCLSSGTRPSECGPSLSRYFGIHKRKLSDTFKARLDFLNLCPVSSQTSEMRQLVSAISRGAGRCDAKSLNAYMRLWVPHEDMFVVMNQLPDYCSVYAGHGYTDLSLPRYIGTPEDGGFWVDAEDYDEALAEYERRRQEEERDRWGRRIR